MGEKLEKFINGIVRVEYWVVTPVFLVMLGLMLVQVACRYVLKIPAPWVDEVTRYLFIAAIFLGGAIATSERSNIEINFTELMITGATKDPQKRIKAGIWANILHDVVSLFLMVIVTYQTYLFMMFQKTTNQMSTAMANFPMWLVAGAMLVGMALITLHLVGTIVLNAMGRGPMGYEFAEEGSEGTCNS